MTQREIKVNLQVALSRNFDKITLGINEEPILTDDANEEVFRQQVRRLFSVLNQEVEHNFKQLQGKK